MTVEADSGVLEDFIQPTSSFLFEWQHKMGHKFFILKGPVGNNYAVTKENRLVYWARPCGREGSRLYVFDRDQMLARMGQERMQTLEKSFGNE